MVGGGVVGVGVGESGWTVGLGEGGFVGLGVGVGFGVGKGVGLGVGTTAQLFASGPAA